MFEEISKTKLQIKKIHLQPMGKFNSCYSMFRQAAILVISILISYPPPSYSNLYHREAKTRLVVLHPKLQSLVPLMDDFQTSFST